MSESQGQAEPQQLLQPYSVDQLAGAVVLCLGAIGSLLLVIWQSRCACRCRIGLSDKCYIFDCSREPPPPEDKKDKKKKDPRDKNPPAASANEAETDDEEKLIPTPRSRKGSFAVPNGASGAQPEPEPEPEMDNLV